MHEEGHMTTISERLRRLSETGANIVSDPLDLAAREAADTIDALVAELEAARVDVVNWYQTFSYSDAERYPAVQRIDTALAKAKGKQE